MSIYYISGHNNTHCCRLLYTYFCNIYALLYTIIIKYIVFQYIIIQYITVYIFQVPTTLTAVASADGVNVIAVGYTGNIFYSKDSGKDRI